MKDTTITVENMSQLVSNTFKECLFKEGEDTSNYVIGEGIKNNFGFNPQRLEQHRELVTAILNELPDDFKKGYTFLGICVNKDGKLWTGEHRVCEQLVAMANALGLMSYCYPRTVWGVLPQRLPYVQIN